MAVIYCYVMIDLEFKVRKPRNVMVQSNWREMLNEAQNLPTTIRTLDPEATPSKSYETRAYQKLEQTEQSRDAYIKSFEARPTKSNMMNNLAYFIFN